MPFDGFVTRAIVKTLNNQLKEARINNIYQHNKHEISVLLRNHKKNLILFMSTNPRFCRVNLTTKKYDNPDHPPSFCMLLRKYLKGGVIKEVKQYEGDRIIDFDIVHRDEFGLEKELFLTVEIMGKHSNIILVDKKNGRILDGIKRIEREFSNKREIMPGILFERPPAQTKHNPWKEGAVNLKSEKIADKEAEKVVLENYQGVSPLLAREIAYRAQLLNINFNEISEGNLERYIEELKQQLDNIKDNIYTGNYEPVMIKDIEKNTYSDFYFIPLKHLNSGNVNNNSSFENVSANLDLMETMDEFYRLKETELQKFNLKTELSKKITQLLKKTRKKLKRQQKEFNESENAENYKIYGELLTANLYIFEGKKPTNTQIEVVNYYKEPQENIKIKLDKSLSPSENAQRYFKKYQKAKARNKRLRKEINNTEAELEYLESISYQLENAPTLEDLEGIKDELIKVGYLEKAKTTTRKKKSVQGSKPLKFVSRDGFDILVGKNNKQNDQLTTKEAAPENIWLHTKEIAGSHVIIKGKDIPLSTIEEAAQIAAYYSKGRNSSNVPVDYTKIKHVRKPKGAKPGMVIYDNHNTLFVTPVKPSD